MESSPSPSLERILVLGWQQVKPLAEVEGSVRCQRSRSLGEKHAGLDKDNKQNKKMYHYIVLILTQCRNVGQDKVVHDLWLGQETLLLIIPVHRQHRLHQQTHKLDELLPLVGRQ